MPQIGLEARHLHIGLRAVQANIEGREPRPLLDDARVIVGQCASRAAYQNVRIDLPVHDAVPDAETGRVDPAQATSDQRIKKDSEQQNQTRKTRQSGDPVQCPGELPLGGAAPLLRFIASHWAGDASLFQHMMSPLLAGATSSKLKINELGLAEYTKHDGGNDRARIHRPSRRERKPGQDSRDRDAVLHQLYDFKQCNPGDGNGHLAQEKLLGGDAFEIPADCEMRQNVPRIGHRVRAKKYPANARQQECARPHDQASCPRSFGHSDQTKCAIARIFANAAGNQIYRMEQYPKDERQICPVPKAANTECNEKTCKMAPLAESAADQENVDVIAKPGRKRNVPTPPEFRNRQRMVWLVEVFHQLEAEHACRADGDVRVT